MEQNIVKKLFPYVVHPQTYSREYAFFLELISIGAEHRWRLFHCLVHSREVGLDLGLDQLDLNSCLENFVQY